MDFQDSVELTRVIALPSEPHMGHELETAIKNANTRRQNIILDFSLVEIMSSGTICSLMILERLLNGVNRQLILCAVPPSIMGIFRLVGLQGLFLFATDEGAARNWLLHHPCPCL
ncbi:MAG: STAS domain-containing protein [Sedimentisphaerales bacterium]|nr:STAS domain-containing protein [Sedimentisphaerales bacterium]